MGDMKMEEALKIVSEGIPKSYMVIFDWVDGCFLRSDHFPDKHSGEPLIASEEEAWRLASQFAQNTVGRCVNIYVIDDKFNPVPDYQSRKITNREWEI
jgi:hypothetical protein